MKVVSGFAVLCLVASGAVSSWFGGKLTEPANRIVGPPPSDLPVEAVTLTNTSGSLLSAWNIPAPEARATLLLFHSLRGNRKTMLERARLFHRAGYSLILIDFQAHGESPGAAITFGFREREDVRATLAFARERYGGNRIGIVACSLGGAATLLASPLEVDAIVLEAVYPTIHQAISNRVARRAGFLQPLLTPALLIQIPLRLGISSDQLRPIDRLPSVTSPILFAAGDKDEHTPLSETEELFEAASSSSSKEKLIFKGAAHVDLLQHDPERYAAEVLKFLNRHLLP